MSENPLNNNKKAQNSPKNWQSLLLLLFFLGLIAAAWFSQSNSSREEKISFSEFRKSYQEGKILINPLEIPEIKSEKDKSKRATLLKNLGLKANSNLKFITAESSASGTLKGMRDINEYRDLKVNPESVEFRILIDPSLQKEQLNRLLGVRNIPIMRVDSLPKSTSNERGIDSLSKLEQWIAADEVLFSPETGIKILKSPNSSEIILSGRRLSYPKKENQKAQWQAFSVDVLLLKLSESDRQLLNIAKPSPENNTMKKIFWNIFPVLLIILALFLLFRFQMKNAGKGAMGFGKSKAKMLEPNQKQISFKDVAGIQEAKEELSEIVDFLKDPFKFEQLGANIPKGVLMIGSPGTGKTLLARAVAGEAEVAFFSISGSDFVEMFVGVGASRVRDMFEQGKKNAPCIVFIDEIDAVGRHRGQGMGGGHDEREQTLNALLVEMDGFDARSGVIIIAATNRPDVLDPALLRPGRFDRQVRVPLPDVVGREQILNVHVKKVKTSSEIDLNLIARGTPGFSGAELANLINEAALLAAREGKKKIFMEHLNESRDKVRWGRERRSLALSDKEKENTAYHEAGHAILNILCEHTDPLHKVTIIPRGPALGVTMMLPEEDKMGHREAELHDNLCVTMGGRVAEELIFKNVTNGASGDIQQATSLARSMVCEWGMSSEIGMVNHDAKDTLISEATAQKIDSEIRRFIDSAYKRATKMLKANLEPLKLISEALLRYETLDGTQVKELLETGEMSNPPKLIIPPEPPKSVENTENKEEATISSEEISESAIPELSRNKLS